MCSPDNSTYPLTNLLTNQKINELAFQFQTLKKGKRTNLKEQEGKSNNIYLKINKNCSRTKVKITKRFNKNQFRDTKEKDGEVIDKETMDVKK